MKYGGQKSDYGGSDGRPHHGGAIFVVFLTRAPYACTARFVFVRARRATEGPSRLV
jgi:hypothetical protein